MKKALLFALLSLTISNLSVFSQTVEPDWGPSRDLEKGTYFHKIAGFDKDGYFLIRSNNILKVTNEKIFLEYYSSTTNDMESIGEVLLPSVNGVQSEYEDLFYLNNKLILFTSIIDGSTRRLYVQYLNNDGTLKNKPKEIGDIPSGNTPQDKFKFKQYSESQVLVYFNNSFLKYNGEPFTFKIINTNLTEDFSEKIELPFKEISFEILQSEVSKNKSIIQLIKAEVPSTKKTSKTTYEFFFQVYNPKTKESTKIVVNALKYIPLNLIFTLDKEDNIIVGGLIANKTRKIDNEFLGAFFQRINPRTFKVESNDPKKNYKLFDKPFIMKYAAERNGLLPEQYYNLILKNIIVFENNGIAFIAEQYYQSEKKMIEPGTKKETIIKYYNYNDLLVFGVNKEGVLDWYKSIPKNQESIDDNGYYHSFVAIQNFNQVKILYNDNASNIKTNDPLKVKLLKNNLNTNKVSGQAAMISIFADGSFEKYPLFPAKDSKVCILPKMVINTSKRILVGCQESKSVRFGTFVFE